MPCLATPGPTFAELATPNGAAYCSYVETLTPRETGTGSPFSDVPIRHSVMGEMPQTPSLPLSLASVLSDIGLQEGGAGLPSQASLEVLSNAVSAEGAKIYPGVDQKTATRALTNMLQKFAEIWEVYRSELLIERQCESFDSVLSEAASTGPPSSLGLSPPGGLPFPEFVSEVRPVPERPAQSRRSSSMCGGPPGVQGTPFNTLPQHLVQSEEWCTVILRNIPNKYDEVMLMEQFALAGLLAETHIRYVYTPKDATNNCNLGYAFVDLVDHAMAKRFISVYEGYRLPSSKSRKVCSASWAKMQSVGVSPEKHNRRRAASNMSTKAPSMSPTVRSVRSQSCAAPPGFDSALRVVGLSPSTRALQLSSAAEWFGPVAHCQIVDGTGEAVLRFNNPIALQACKKALSDGVFVVGGQVLRESGDIDFSAFSKSSLEEIEFNMSPLDDYLAGSAPSNSV